MGSKIRTRRQDYLNALLGRKDRLLLLVDTLLPPPAKILLSDQDRFRDLIYDKSLGYAHGSVYNRT